LPSQQTERERQIMNYEGTHIVVFYDRVKNKPGSVSSVLGHVIAHEVAHILQGLMRLRDRHHEGATDWRGLPTNGLEAAPVH
jgi:hypothetical protein